MENTKIVIVGGGVSGLAAAYELKKAGYTADLYEASPYVGGRCRNDPHDGYPFYVGAGSTEPQWETTFQYLKEFGLEDRVLEQAGEASLGLYAKGRLNLLTMGNNPLELLGGIRKLIGALPPKLYPQGVRFLKMLMDYRKKIDYENADFTVLEDISDVSIADWAKAHRMEELNTYLLDPIVSSMVCADSDKVAMGHLVLLFSLMQGICSLDGGMGIISEALYERVQEMVHLNTKVEEVVISEGAVQGVRIGGKLIEADHVIVALDAVATRELVPGLSADQDAALATCKYSRVFYYMFGLEEPIPELEHGAVFFAANEPSLISVVSDAGGDPSHPVITAQPRIKHFDWLASMSAEERDRLVIWEIRKVIPSFPEEPKITKCYRWDRAVNLEGPGQFKAINKLKAAHMEDIEGLQLAGDYLFLIASTEGSMDAGKRAAHRIINKLASPEIK